jgi:hypothetical protein
MDRVRTRASLVRDATLRRAPRKQLSTRSALRRHATDLKSKHKLRLHLEHPRRINIRERRDSIRRSSHRTHELPERRYWRLIDTENRHATSKEVPVIEKIEAFQSQQNRPAF